MARTTFGGTLADYVVLPESGVYRRPGSVEVTVWDAQAGGTQLTDLLLLDGTPVTSLRTGSEGLIPAFQGPDGVKEAWYQVAGASQRYRIATGPVGAPGAPGQDGAPGGSDEAMAAWIDDEDSQTRASLSDVVDAGVALAEVLVVHGSDANYPRPPGPFKIWQGTVQPLNMLATDWFAMPEAPPPPPQFAPFATVTDWHTATWADQITGTSDGTALATLADGSGNGRAFGDYDTDTTRRPLYRAADTDLNGKPAVVFDGTNDAMKTAAFTAVAQPWSFCLVGYAPATGALASFFDAPNGTTSRGRHQRDTSNVHNLFAGSSLAGSNVNKFVMIGKFDGTTSSLTINGTTVTGTTGTANSITQLFLGARRDATWPANLHLAFLGIVARAFTTDEAAELTSTAGTTYAITVA